MELPHAISLAVIVIIAVGLALRRRAKAHMALMTLAFLADLGLLLYVEFSRQAIEKALGGIDALLGFHIAVSTGVLVLYVLQLRLGLALYRGRPAVRERHRQLGIAFVVLRLLNLVTSFYV